MIIKKHFPIKAQDGFLDKDRVIAFTRNRKLALKCLDTFGSLQKRQTISFEEIDLAIQKAAQLDLDFFVLKNNSSYSINYFQKILEIIGRRKIRRITSYTREPLAIELRRRIFFLAPMIHDGVILILKIY